MTNVDFTIPVPNIAQVLIEFDRIKIYRAAANIDIDFAEITNGSTRVVLTSNTTSYTFTDATGGPTYWYKTSFFNSTTSAESSLSSARQGAGDPALAVISASELREQYLAGIPQVDGYGNVILTTNALEQFIREAVAYIEQLIGVPLRTVVTTDEHHDYYSGDYVNLNWIRLNIRPLISVQVLRVGTENGPLSLIPISWVKITSPQMSQIQVYPDTSQSVSMVLLQGGTPFYPLMNFFSTQAPNIFHVDYTAGFEAGKIPPELRGLVGMVAAPQPLAILGDIIHGPGLSGAKVSMDALMTDTRTTKSAKGGAFAGRISMYQEMIKDRIYELRTRYSGIGSVVS